MLKTIEIPNLGGFGVDKKCQEARHDSGELA